MSKKAATHENAVVSGGSGDNAPFSGIGSVGASDDTTLTPGSRDANGNPTVVGFAGSGKTSDWVTNTQRDTETGHSSDPKNR